MTTIKSASFRSDNSVLNLALDWLAGYDTGESSKAILKVAMNMDVSRRPQFESAYPFPHDPSDFGKCLRLLEAIPEFTKALSVLSSNSREWSYYEQNWDRMKEIYQRDLSSGRSDELFRLMRKFQRMAECDAINEPYKFLKENVFLNDDLKTTSSSNDDFNILYKRSKEQYGNKHVIGEMFNTLGSFQSIAYIRHPVNSDLSVDGEVLMVSPELKYKGEQWVVSAIQMPATISIGGKTMEIESKYDYRVFEIEPKSTNSKAPKM